MLARPELDEISHKMLAAADLLINRGWCRFQRITFEGQHCLLGALDVVQGEHKATERLAAVLPLIEGKDEYEKSTYWNGKLPDNWKVANWNNYACKSAEEAADKLREAAYAPVKDQVY